MKAITDAVDAILATLVRRFQRDGKWSDSNQDIFCLAVLVREYELRLADLEDAMIEHGLFDTPLRRAAADGQARAARPESPIPKSR